MISPSIHTLLLLSLTFLSLPLPTTPQSTPSKPSIIFSGTLPSPDPLPNIVIDPTITKSSLITLVGNLDTITISFLQDLYDPETYKLKIKTNNVVDSSQTTTFDTREEISLNLDLSRSLLILQGTKRFRISKFVREQEYQVQAVEQIKNPADGGFDTSTQKQNSKSSGVDKNTTYFIIAGVFGGLIGGGVVIKVVFIIAKLIRNRIIDRDLRLRNTRTRDDVEPTGPNRGTVYDEHTRDLFCIGKGSLNLDGRRLSENEIDAVHLHLHKKEYPSSLTSLESGTGGMARATAPTAASTLSMVPSNNSLKEIGDSSRGEFRENSRGTIAHLSRNSKSKKSEVTTKKGSQLEAITEECSYVKTMEPFRLPPLKLDEIKGKSKKRLTNPKVAPARNTQTGNGARLAKSENELKSHEENKVKIQPKVVSIMAIRELVEKAIKEQEQDNNNCSIEISEQEEESSEDESQPTDYFSCMICSKDKRNAIVDPCGHVFGCVGCASRIAKCSKGCCILCSKRITGYRVLEPN